MCGMANMYLTTWRYWGVTCVTHSGAPADHLTTKQYRANMAVQSVARNGTPALWKRTTHSSTISL